MTISIVSESGLSTRLPPFIIDDSQTIADLRDYMNSTTISNLNIKTSFTSHSIQCLRAKRITPSIAITIYPILDYLACIKLLIRFGQLILSMVEKIPPHILAIIADIPTLGINAVMRGILPYTRIIRPVITSDIDVGLLRDYIDVVNDPYEVIDSIKYMRLNCKSTIPTILGNYNWSTIKNITRYMINIDYEEGVLVALQCYPVLISVLYRLILRSKSITMIDYIYKNRLNSELEYVSPENWFLASMVNKNAYGLRLLPLTSLNIELDKMILSCRNNHSMMDHMNYVLKMNSRRLTTLFSIAMLVTGHCQESDFLVNRHINVNDITEHIELSELTMTLLLDDNVDPDRTVQCLLLMKKMDIMNCRYLNILLLNDGPRIWYVIVQLIRNESSKGMYDLLDNATNYYLSSRDEVTRYYSIWFIKVLLSIMPKCDYTEFIIKQFPPPIARSLIYK